MSLVNDMLRDLNRRTPVSNQAARVNGTISSQQLHANKPDSRVGVALVLLVVAGLLGGYLYFEKIKSSVAPLPQAVRPVAPVAASTEPAPVADAAKVVLNIIQEISSDVGFTLRVQASADVDYAIVDRHAYGLTLHLDGIDNFDRSSTNIGGMSVLLAGGGVNIEFDLNNPVDFMVYEDAKTDAFDILLSATWRRQDVSSRASAPAQPDQLASGAQVISVNAAGSAALPAADSAALTQRRDAVVPVVNRGSGTSGGVRVNRQLSLEERDRNNSQAAVVMLQSGRLFEAYERLLVFIAENPAAHQSRETLATLLLAQQDYPQARAIIDEGLALVPNYSAYKKIKARLLMMDNDMAQAMLLLRNLPPVLADDPEYHELLASLFQQTGQHGQAVVAYQELLRFNSKQGRWWTGLGISLEAQGKGSDALASYQAALQSADLDVSLRQYSQNRIRSLSVQ